MSAKLLKISQKYDKNHLGEVDLSKNEGIRYKKRVNTKNRSDYF